MTTPSLPSKQPTVGRDEPPVSQSLGGLRSWLSAGVLAALLAAVSALGCNNAVGPNKEQKRAEVVVTTPILDPAVIDYQDFTGRLDAFRTVDIRARVSGYIKQAPFKEGALVKQDDLLFEIDPKPYQADLDVAEANLNVARTDEVLQMSNADRARKLIATGGISREDYDTAIAAQEKATATVGSMKASRDKARLYLDYTKVTAPLAGRVSRRNVDPGNLVTADTTLLTTIVTVSPVFAYFDVDERTFLDLQNSAAAARHSWFTGLQFPVLMRLANEDKFALSGKVNFIDNRVIATTGTIRMRGVFENPSGDLKSGLFVRIRLPIGKPYPADLIPDEALQTDQGRKYLLVVKDVKNIKTDDKGRTTGTGVVEYRPVETGQAIGTLRVIKKGLAMPKEGQKEEAREYVIISGQQRVRLNSKEVQEVEVDIKQPPDLPPSPMSQLFPGSSRKPAGEPESTSKKPAKAE